MTNQGPLRSCQAVDLQPGHVQFNPPFWPWWPLPCTWLGLWREALPLPRCDSGWGLWAGHPRALG